MPTWQRKPWLNTVGRDGWTGLLIAVGLTFAIGGVISLLGLLIWGEERAISLFQTTLTTMGLVAVVRGFAILMSRGKASDSPSDE